MCNYEHGVKYGTCLKQSVSYANKLQGVTFTTTGEQNQQIAQTIRFLQIFALIDEEKLHKSDNIIDSKLLMGQGARNVPAD